MFYFGRKLTIGEEFDLSYKITDYIYNFNIIYIPQQKICVPDRISSYSKTVKQYVIKDIPLLKKLLLDDYCDKDINICNYNSIITLTKQQKIIEVSKFKDIYELQKNSKDSDKYSLIFKHHENTYQNIMTLFTNEIAFYKKESKKIKDNYELQLYRNSIF